MPPADSVTIRKTRDSLLEQIVSKQCERIQKKRNEIISLNNRKGNSQLPNYSWCRLEYLLNKSVQNATSATSVQIKIDLISRDKFGGDIALKVPSLLADGGPKRFISEHLPAIVAELNSASMKGVVERVETKGMYINITLRDEFLLRTAEHVSSQGILFGNSDVFEKKNVVVDYSSPNVAKVLHAGHIRSTIVGEVLSNMYDACGANVFRINHINDFGGFGFLLEGYRRFQDTMPANSTQNDCLLAVYSVRRTLEKLATNEIEAQDWSDVDREIMSRFFPDIEDLAGLKKAFAEFTAASNERFEKLEAGDPEEVELWQQMVQWSLSDFQAFYHRLDIDIDFTIGESFYFRDGVDVVKQACAEGRAEIFSVSAADEEIRHIDSLKQSGEISEPEAEVRIQAVRKDVGSTVARLPSGERMVLLRSDGRSIYATRDIGALYRRRDLFSPDLIAYVVGQEQKSHFQRLFAAAKVLGIVDLAQTELKHIYFGFYVDETSGKKLSSRDSVANVNSLLQQAEKFFYDRLSGRDNVDEMQRRQAARDLTVGSLIFNDLKQDIKGSVEIDTSCLDNTIRGFERSGGAYVIYTVCRARSILRRHGKPPERVDSIQQYNLSSQEALLLLMLQQMPIRLAESAQKANPTFLLRHLLEIAMEYNSYYTAVPVFENGVANDARLLITAAVQIVLSNGLAVCHINTPDSI